LIKTSKRTRMTTNIPRAIERVYQYEGCPNLFIISPTIMLKMARKKPDA
jgi:hypothetical protein